MPDSAKSPMALNRRSFIKAGVVGASTLGGATSISGCATTTQVSRPKDSRFKYLREKDVVILKAITPAVLPAEFTGSPEQNQAKLERFIPRVDDFLVHSCNFTQVALEDLFDKLSIAPVRVLLTGMWTGWEKATPEQINEFLIDWRDSSFNLLRGGYSQLTQLVTVIWYSQPENWPATHYPGPPKHITG